MGGRAVIDTISPSVEPTHRLRSGALQEATLRLLNGFELTCSRGVIDLPKAVQRLLAFLALHDRPLVRLYVAGALWPDQSEERASACLRTELWRLHRAGLDLIQSSRTHLGIRPAVSLDVREMASRARRMLAAAIPCGVSDLDLLMFCGELLPDWYEEWVVAERDRLRQLRLHALEALCRRFIDTGRYPEAVQAGLAAVRAEPLRESARRLLIEAYLGEGNEAQAMGQYAEYRGLLFEELGVDPTQAIQELIGRVRLGKGLP